MSVVYFDLDGTLLEYEVPFREIYEAALERCGVEPQGFETYNGAFFDTFGEAEDPFAAGIAETDVEVDPAAFSDAIVEAEAERVRPVPGAREVLDALADDHDLGVLTNGVGRVQRDKLERAGLADRFEAVVVSGEVGARKPDPEIYRIAERELPGEEHAFVADDVERDLRPAVDRGWRGIHVGDDAPEGGRTAADDVRRVEALPGVLEVV